MMLPSMGRWAPSSRRDEEERAGGADGWVGAEAGVDVGRDGGRASGRSRCSRGSAADGRSNRSAGRGAAGVRPSRLMGSKSGGRCSARPSGRCSTRRGCTTGAPGAPGTPVVRRSARAFISRLLECSRPSRSASDAASRRRSSSAMVGDDGLGGDMLLYGRVRGRRRQTAPHPRQLALTGPLVRRTRDRRIMDGRRRRQMANGTTAIPTDTDARLRVGDGASRRPRRRLVSWHAM